MKKIAKTLLFYFIVQLELQNSLGCASTKTRRSIRLHQSSKITSKNIENVMKKLVEEMIKFEEFQVRYNKSYLDAKEVSRLGLTCFAFR